jgi:hypothetical protein
MTKMTKEWLELYHAVNTLLINAEVIPDPKMKGLTDTYSVPLDDIETLETVMEKIRNAVNERILNG